LEFEDLFIKKTKNHKYHLPFPSPWDRGVPTYNDSTVPTIRGSVTLPYFLTSTDFLFELPDFPFQDVSSLSRSFEVKLLRELFQLISEFPHNEIFEPFVDFFSMLRLADT
jgi:hypothetical protein